MISYSVRGKIFESVELAAEYCMMEGITMCEIEEVMREGRPENTTEEKRPPQP